MSDQEQGIKLFGTTITLQETKVLQGTKVKTDDQVKENPTADDKRPDKIIPCPRCKSMETKFCYFNNYNVNQPRHFCKGCQRYWTAGGALRNVPVGAGRRKNKLPGGRDFPDNCLFDTPGGLHQYDELHKVVVEDWQLAAAARGGFQHVIPLKRQRISSGVNSC